RGIEYFFPEARFEMLGPVKEDDSPRPDGLTQSGTLDLAWLGFRHRLSLDPPGFSTHEARLVDAIRRVLSARYHLLFDDAALAAQRLHLFRGLPEDRYVSAFLDATPHTQVPSPTPDRVSDAIEVLRMSALTTYENRRIETGVLLYGTTPDDCHVRR